MSRNSPAVLRAGVNHTNALSTRDSQRPGAKLAQSITMCYVSKHLKSSEECHLPP